MPSPTDLRSFLTQAIKTCSDRGHSSTKPAIKDAIKKDLEEEFLCKDAFAPTRLGSILLNPTAPTSMYFDTILCIQDRLDNIVNKHCPEDPGDGPPGGLPVAVEKREPAKSGEPDGFWSGLTGAALGAAASIGAAEAALFLVKRHPIVFAASLIVSIGS